MAVQLTEAQKREFEERQKREFAALTQTFRRLGDAIGLAPICPEPACARARRCVGPPNRVMPLCWTHYLEEIRFFYLPALKEAKARFEGPEGWPDPPRPPKRPSLTLLEALYGPDLSRLRRPKGAPGSDCHERNPEGFARYLAAGDWREPFRVGREGGRKG